MAVLIEGISVVIRATTSVDRYPGRHTLFREDCPNETLCTDGELVRVGFMTPQDTKESVEGLNPHGLGELLSEQFLLNETPEAVRKTIEKETRGGVLVRIEKAHPEDVALIRPNKSLWLLPNGRVIDTQTEGVNHNGSAFSHGLYVKDWVNFRLKEFHPDAGEVAQAEQIRRRVKELFKADPSLNQPRDGEGHDNPYAGDLAYNLAAEELGWVRIKPATLPSETQVYFETLLGKLTPEQEAVMNGVVDKGYKVHVLTGGALKNRPAATGGVFNKATSDDLGPPSIRANTASGCAPSLPKIQPNELRSCRGTGEAACP